MKDSARNIFRKSVLIALALPLIAALLVLMLYMFGPKLIGRGPDTKDMTKINMVTIQNALQLFVLDTGRFPTTDEGLGALMTQLEDLEGWKGPYLLSADTLLDLWKRPIIYRCPGEHGEFDLISYGRDGHPGGSGEDKDIVNWEHH
jgi:general secretion pathway protein G